jgi:hypothetical protein
LKPINDDKLNDDNKKANYTIGLSPFYEGAYIPNTIGYPYLPLLRVGVRYAKMMVKSMR